MVKFGGNFGPSWEPPNGRKERRKLAYRFIEPAGRGFRAYWLDAFGKLTKGTVRDTELEAHNDALKEKVRVGVRQSGTAASQNHSLANAMDLVISIAKKHGRAEETIKNYEHRHSRLLKVWPGGKIALKDITREQIQTYIDNLVKAGRSPRTVHHQAQALGNIFNTALRHDWVVHNPVLRVIKPSCTRSKTDKGKRQQTLGPVSFQDIETYGKHMRAQTLEGVDCAADADILRLFWATALRQSELAGVQLGEIDLKNRVMHIEEGKKRPRDLYICTELKKLLKRMVVRAVDRGQTHLVFGDNRTRRKNTLRFALERWAGCTKLGRKDEFKATTLNDPRLKSHDIRSASGSHMARCRVPNEIIAHVLGHDLGAQSVTQLYVGVYGPDVEKAMRCLWVDHEEWLRSG